MWRTNAAAWTRPAARLTREPMSRAYINFHAPVNGASAQHFMATCSQLVQQKRTELYLLLSTPGGNVMSGLTVYNVLRALPCRIITHNVGNIDSIGNAIFLTGEERYACPHSTFTFHGVGLDINNMRFEEKNTRGALQSILADQKRIGDIIQERTKIGADEAGELFREARTKNAKEAHTSGIVHAVQDVVIPPGAPIFSLVIT
jgi:ATP-dependent protease ClpP protease subunit